MSQSHHKVSLITGGSKRIGAAIGRKLHAQGHQLLIHYNGSHSAAEAIQAELNQTRANSVHLMQADLRQSDAPTRLINHCLDAFGQLDVLVNNASAFYPTPIESANEHDWQQLLDINLKAPFFLCQAAAAALAKQQGCIINLIDIYAQRPLAQHPIYAASKAGLASLTQSLARDLAPDIRVNGIAPGAILWPKSQDDSPVGKAAQAALLERTPLKRLGKAEDIANIAYFLADQAPFITGQIINVDGGRTVVP